MNYTRLQQLTTATSTLTLLLVGVLFFQKYGAIIYNRFYRPITESPQEIIKWYQDHGLEYNEQEINENKISVPFDEIQPGEEFSYVMGLCKHLDIPGHLTVQIVGKGTFDTTVFNDFTKGNVNECRGFEHKLGELPLMEPGTRHLVFHMRYDSDFFGKPVSWDYSYTSNDFEIVETDTQKVVE